MARRRCSRGGGLVLAAMALAVMAGCGGGGESSAVELEDWTSFNPVTALTAETFRDPPGTDRPWVRWNFPESADVAELQAELVAMQEAGISGAEIGQGGFPNNEQLVAIFTKANELGITISLSHGPTMGPPGYSINDDHARKTLVFGSAAVSAGESFTGALPEPQVLPPAPEELGLYHDMHGNLIPRQVGGGGGGNAASIRSTLVAVLAYRCTESPSPESGVAELDPSSVIDLTENVTGKNTDGVLGGTTAGSLEWTAPGTPGGAQWQLISFWSQGVSAQPDPFSEEGHKQLIEGLDAALSPEVKELMKTNGGDIFYDSHSSARGSPDELWTNRMAELFGILRNYALIPNLAALFPRSFRFSDGSAPRVRNDLYALRGNLWIENHLTPLRTWLRQYNQKLRLQPEGERTITIPINDQVQAAAALDRPEHESLFAGDEVDNYLPIASANHVTGNPWYSTECCATRYMNYAQTFQDVIIRMHKSFAGGITKLVYHVYPYRDSDTAQWPGYSNFTPVRHANAWGPREPIWADARVYNDYLARTQQVLSQGRAKTDVAVYMLNYLYPEPHSNPGGFRIWRDTSLEEAGYTRDYLNPTLLDRGTTRVEDGRLAPRGPAYKALIIDSEQEMPVDPVKTTMPILVIERILGFAESGLPVIVVGTPPNETPWNRPQTDARLRERVDELLATETVHRVEHEADVPEMLRSLGIRPSAEPELPSPMLSVHRRDEETSTDYYFLYSQGVVTPEGEPANLFEPATGEPLDRMVTLEGRGQPYLLDGWSGEIRPIAEYRSGVDTVTVRVELARDDAMLIAISDEPGRFGTAAVAAESTPSGLTAPIELTDATWYLEAEEWQPANPYETTFGLAATETWKAAVEVDLQGLRPWPEIPELRHASGLGTYTTTFDMPSDWSSQRGAVLSLGEVFDSFTLKVNGTAVPANQLSAEADVGPYLKAGANTIEVRVATTLNNRLAVLDADVAERGLVQPYGLVGPVVLRAYGQAGVE